MKWRRNFIGKPPEVRHLGWYVPKDETRGFGWEIESTGDGFVLKKGSFSTIATFRKCKDAMRVAELIEGAAL
jgi:hypothetical protein